MAFDVQAAKKAGYSEDEILNHLTESRKFDIQGALSSGYSKQELIDHLSSTPKISPPQYAQPNIPKTGFGQAVSGIVKGIGQEAKGLLDTGEMLLKEKAKQDINRMIPGGTQLLNYGAKKLGINVPKESVASLAQAEAEKRKGIEPGTLLKGNTPIEKGFKTGTQVALLFAPLGKAGVATKIKEGAVVGGNLAKKVVTRAENLAEIVSPPLNKAVRTEALGAGEKLSAKELSKMSAEDQKIFNELRAPGVKTTGKSVFTKIETVANKEVEDIVSAVKSAGVKLKSGVKEVGKNITRLEGAERKEFFKVSKIVDEYAAGKGSKYIPDDADKIISSLQNKINEMKKLPQRTVDLAGDVEKMYDKIWGIAKNQLREKVSKSGGLTQKEILKSLREWNIKASKTAAFEGKENIKKIAIQDVRKAFRDTLVESLPKNIGKQVDESFKRSHAFIDALKNIRDKNNLLVGAESQAGKAWTAGKKAAVGLGAAGLIGGAGYSIGSNIVGD